jgi:IS30 family transposase
MELIIMVHLTYDNRCAIEIGLKENKTLVSIAKEIGFHPTTIAREIKRNGKGHVPSLKGIGPSHCVRYDSCNIRKNMTRYSTCRPETCSLFKFKICEKLKKSPFVCNGCDKRKGCKSFKYLYTAKEAQQKYERNRTESREGINTPLEKIEEYNAILTPLIQEKNQPLTHILTNHKEIELNIKTVYSYINRGVFDVKNIDLPRKVKYKPRHKFHEVKIERKCRENRTYHEFLEYLDENHNPGIVEMDTVEGEKGGKVILTLYFRNSHFMIMRLLETKRSKEVCDALDEIERAIGLKQWKKMFPIILTDNGSEFSNPSRMETSCIDKTIKRTSIYYCDPGHSEQKGRIEKNHEYIRYVWPKGTTFKRLSETEVWYYNNQINNVTRQALNYKTPYLLAEFIWGEVVLEQLKCKYVAPDDVTLS